MGKYEKKEWKSGADGQTPINVASLNNIENGIETSLNKDIGFVAFYCRNYPPDGWLVCDGSEVSRETYKDLFNCIGVTFGDGDRSTTFNLPDLRGEFIRGWNGTSSGTDAYRGFGTKQEGTSFYEDGAHMAYIGDAENAYESRQSDYSPGGWGDYKVKTSHRIRPNNIALLPCIYTGVFNG